MNLVNLLDETERILDINGKTKNDIRWIGGHYFTISVDEFIQLANVHYDNDYGAQKVASDLIIVGDNWWLERVEYDGSEGWAFKTFPIMPTTHCDNPISLMCGQNNDYRGWRELIELNHVNFD